MPVIRRNDTAGFTVAELAITVALSMTVMATLIGILVSQTSADKRMSAFADNQEQLRQAVVLMQRDIRSSEPLNELDSPTEDYRLLIELDVYDSIDAVNPTPIRWRVDPVTDELLREQLDGSDPPNVVAVTHRVTGVVNDESTPLFSYYSASSTTPYDVTIAPSADIAHCTMRVHIDLVGAPTAGPSPGTLESDAQLRNRLPGGLGCTESGSVL